MRRVRKLELKARRMVRESFAGEFQTSFRGQGLDFDDFREYQHGDEVRFIDWKVTARMNQPFIRKFREEREMSVIFAVDVSGSIDYGSVNRSKREIAAEAAALLGFSAVQNNNKVGLLVFADEPILFVPPAKGTRHLLRLVREILTAQPQHRGTSLKSASDFLMRTLRRRALVFMISDFLVDDLRTPLAKLAYRHETIALRVYDPVEKKLPTAGTIVLFDSETGAQCQINTRNANLRMAYAKLTKRQREGTDALFKKHGIDSAELGTHEDPLPSLHRLLRSRRRKRIRP